MKIVDIISNALKEDIGDGDHSALSCVPKDAKGSAKLLVKEEGVVAGVEVAKEVFRQVDDSLEVECYKKDGDRIVPGDIVLRVKGSSQSILSAERTMLNLMQRMSGIASISAKVCKALEGTKCRVLDTRKTTPGLRVLEKMAVEMGGGVNHRFGLYDMVMIKDNHIDYCGGIHKAVQEVHDYFKEKNLDLKIEVETRDLKELDEVLSCPLRIDRVMLDNYSYDDLREAVKRVNGKMETEASGGITLDTARNYAECGVDFISLGALTHSVKSLDLSLKAE